MAGTKGRRKGRKGQHGEPWLRKQTGTYYITIDGKKINLRTSDKAEAYRKLEAMQDEPTDDPFVAALIDRFLGWLEKEVKRKRNKPGTYDTLARFLVGTWSKATGEKLTDGFRDFVGDMRVSELTKLDIENWLDDRYPDSSQNTRAGAVRSVKRVLSWATNSRDELKTAIITENPIKGMRVPEYVPKRVWISDEQWATVAAQYGETDPFSDVLRAVWITGVRPQELRMVEARHYNRATSRWEFPATEAKGKLPRFVTLVPEIVEMTERLIAQHPTGPLFRNRDGRSWESAALSRRLVRLKQKMRKKLDDFPGFKTVEDVDKVTLYSGRKTYITNGLKNGTDPITMRHLAGHMSGDMIDKVYGAVEHDIDHMQAAARRAIGDG